MNKIIVILVLWCSLLSTGKGQNRKDIVNNKVKSQTTYEIDYENSNGKEIKEKFEKYDAKGNVIEIIEYDAKGKMDNHDKYEYNSNNELLKEVKINPNGQVYKTIEYKYVNGLKTKKITYDQAGKKIKVKTYMYEYYP